MSTKLAPKERDLVQRFLSKASRDEEGYLCVPFYNDKGEVSLYEGHTSTYRRWALLRIQKLIDMNLFTVKVKRVKRDRKFLCGREETLLQYLS